MCVLLLLAFCLLCCLVKFVTVQSVSPLLSPRFAPYSIYALTYRPYSHIHNPHACFVLFPPFDDKACFSFPVLNTHLTNTKTPNANTATKHKANKKK